MATFSYSGKNAQDDMIGDVEVYADQVTATGQTIGINREAIYDKLVTAMRNVFNAAPRHAVDKAASDGSGQGAVNTNNYTSIALPDDFSRFLELRLAEWERHVYEMVDPRSNRVRLQYNPHTAADTYNPVVAKVPDPGSTSGEALRAWPQDGGPSIDEFSYLPELAPEEAPEILKESIVLFATSYYLASQREQGWEIMRQAARLILQQVEAGQQPMVQQAIQEARERIEE